MLNIVKNDPWLTPYADAIEGRYNYYEERLQTLTERGQRTLTDFANGHNWYGLHRTAEGGWVFREWAPNATAIWLVGDFNDWQRRDDYRLARLNPHGDWEVTLPDEALCHGQHYKMLVEWEGGCGERIPAYAQRVVQDAFTAIFSAQVWDPCVASYKWKKKTFRPRRDPLLIYECPIGMAQDEERAKNYQLVKGYMDEFHKAFIQGVLSKTVLPNLDTYADLYYKQNKSDKKYIRY